MTNKRACKVIMGFPARADALTLRNVSFSYSIFLEVVGRVAEAATSNERRKAFRPGTQELSAYAVPWWKRGKVGRNTCPDSTR